MSSVPLNHLPPYPLPDSSLIIPSPATTALINTLNLPPHDESLTLWQQAKQFSLQNKVFVIFLVLLYISMFNTAPLCAAFIPAFALPPALLLFMYKRSRNYKHIELEILGRLYSIGFTTGSLVVLLIETVLTALFGIICFSDQLQRYLAEWSDAISGQTDPKHQHPFDPTTDDSIPRNFQYYAFLFLLCYVSAGCVEEGLKYWAINRIKQYRPTIQSESAVIYYSVAVALGFSTIENIGYLTAACTEADYVWEIALSAVERMVISTPLHCMTAVLIGIGVVRRDLQREPLKLWQIMLLPIIFHGTFDFGLMTISSVNAQLGDITSLVLTLAFVFVVLVALGATIRVQWRKYRINDPSKAGFALVNSESADIEAQQQPPAAAAPMYTPQYMQPAAYELYFNSLTDEQKRALRTAQEQLQSYQSGSVVVPIQNA